MQIFLLIMRKTYGFGKKVDRIALSQFQSTGIKKTHVSRAIEKLIEMNLITNKGNENGISYGINKNYSEWKPLPKKGTVPNKGNLITNKGNEKYPIMGTTKETTKETIKRKENFSATEDFKKTFDWFWGKYASAEGRGRSGNKKQTLERMTRALTNKDMILRFSFAVNEYLRQVDEENYGKIPERQRALKLPEVFVNQWEGYIPEDIEERISAHRSKANAATE